MSLPYLYSCQKEVLLLSFSPKISYSPNITTHFFSVLPNPHFQSPTLVLELDYLIQLSPKYSQLLLKSQLSVRTLFLFKAQSLNDCQVILLLGSFQRPSLML